ncbi:endoplasmic reticulum-based factor for assembly of v-atpase [Cystoisospora suis]|uniref:Endoplasmic reticulum-based factor for assembly of v-atpase n=1 Tax=Cystoisospora suis TaxID=483139 RepID=A0A2C6L232_9APIC|nr:endoplasmic reticulum-based factor for assembly of v-atpase [Cystoisospora suis]
MARKANGGSPAPPLLSDVRGVRKRGAPGLISEKKGDGAYTSALHRRYGGSVALLSEPNDGAVSAPLAIPGGAKVSIDRALNTGFQGPSEAGQIDVVRDLSASGSVKKQVEETKAGKREGKEEARSTLSSGPSLFIRITPDIRSFLEKAGRLVAAEFKDRTAIDLDVLTSLTRKYNLSRQGSAPTVTICELVEKSYIVARAPPQKLDIDSLPASERFRLLSEERKYKATVRQLFGTKNEDVFANYSQSLA